MLMLGGRSIIRSFISPAAAAILVLQWTSRSTGATSGPRIRGRVPLHSLLRRGRARHEDRDFLAAVGDDEYEKATPDPPTSSLQLEGGGDSIPVHYPCAKWATLIEKGKCGFKAKEGLSCEERSLSLVRNVVAEDRELPNKTYKVYQFGPGTFGIDRQVLVPPFTILQGFTDPSINTDASGRAERISQGVMRKLSFAHDRLHNGPFRAVDFSPSTGQQTLILATKAVNIGAPYCGAAANIKHVKIGFVMSSNTVARNLNYQGIDRGRPADSRPTGTTTSCGGAVFETKGCSYNHCYGLGGNPAMNNADADGRASQNVLIENIRINDVYSTADGTRKDKFQDYTRLDAKKVRGAQMVFWVPATRLWLPKKIGKGFETRGKDWTKNIVVRNIIAYSTHAGGVHISQRAENVFIENVHIQNTGDDGFALKGAGLSSNVVFKDCEIVNPGVLHAGKNYYYGNCAALYGAGGPVVFQNFRCVAPLYAAVSSSPGSPNKAVWQQCMSLGSMISIRGDNIQHTASHPVYDHTEVFVAEGYELVDLDEKNTTHLPSGKPPPHGLAFSPSDDSPSITAPFSLCMWPKGAPKSAKARSKPGFFQVQVWMASRLSQNILYGEKSEHSWYGMMARPLGFWAAEEAINGQRVDDTFGGAPAADSVAPAPFGLPDIVPVATEDAVTDKHRVDAYLRENQGSAPVSEAEATFGVCCGQAISSTATSNSTTTSTSSSTPAVVGVKHVKLRGKAGTEKVLIKCKKNGKEKSFTLKNTDTGKDYHLPCVVGVGEEFTIKFTNGSQDNDGGGTDVIVTEQEDAYNREGKDPHKQPFLVKSMDVTGCHEYPTSTPAGFCVTIQKGHLLWGGVYTLQVNKV